MGSDEAEKSLNGRRVSGVVFHGFAHGASFAGIHPGGYGHLCYQLSGTRLITTVDLSELVEVYFKFAKGPGDDKGSTPTLQDIPYDMTCWFWMEIERWFGNKVIRHSCRVGSRIKFI